MNRFSIEHDRAYVLPMLRLPRKANPDLFLFSSPWSPPGWMKARGSLYGGSLRQRYFGPYAQYFLKFLQAYAAEGVPVQAVTVQNEVDTDQDGRMSACLWPQEYEIGFVKNHLGPLLQQNSLSTTIWILDHNYNLWGGAICELDDEEPHKYCNAGAFHGYVGTPEMMSKFTRPIPRRKCTGPKAGPITRLPTMQPTGRTGATHLRRRCETGARHLAVGTWHSTKKAAQYWSVFRRVGDHQLADKGNHAQRPVSGGCPFFAQRLSRRPEI